MNNFLKTAKKSASAFLNDEEGAQVIEYALIIAIVSIALAVALKTITGGTPFSTLVSRLATCLGNTGTCS